MNFKPAIQFDAEWHKMQGCSIIEMKEKYGYFTNKQQRGVVQFESDREKMLCRAFK